MSTNNEEKFTFIRKIKISCQLISFFAQSSNLTLLYLMHNAVDDDEREKNFLVYVRDTCIIDFTMKCKHDR